MWGCVPNAALHGHVRSQQLGGGAAQPHISAPTCTKRGMVLSRKISMRFMRSRARMCSAPVQPSTISSILTPSCEGMCAQMGPRAVVPPHTEYGDRHPASLRTPGCAGTHRVGLLCAGCHVTLRILVSLHQQLHQAWDDGRLLQRAMVGRAQGQVADQPNGGLQGGHGDSSGRDQRHRAPRGPPVPPPAAQAASGFLHPPAPDPTPPRRGARMGFTAAAAEHEQFPPISSH